MKNSRSLLLAAIATLTLSSAPAFATIPASGASATRDEVKPYPIKVVNPTQLPRSFTKSTVEVALTLDEHGVPTAVQPIGRVDKRVASRLVAAVSQWRFAPKTVNGVPVAGQFVLPIELKATEGA